MTHLPQPHGLIGNSPVFREMLEILHKIAGYDATVLISGETGSGKELAARAIHYLSARRDKPFIPVNCGALPDHLIENELFGHNRGAYTDARESQAGLIAQAEGGTLFLDEVDALSPKAQVSLLRFLQDGQYRPLGSSRTESAQVRVLAASNVELEQQVEEGHFRADLLFRLNVMELPVPPLRARGGDIELLARHFIAEAACRYKVPSKELHPDTLEWLASQPWPGNIRELQNRIQREFLLADGPLLRIRAPVLSNERRRQPDRRHGISDTLNFNEAKQNMLQAFERSHLLRLMRECAGNVSQAARMAGKERRALGKLLKKYQIEANLYR
ncbi:MAG: sigma-54 dependent transcriptional regulator [Gallionellaceae bacterium]|nr:sigma-54 dependent transcriptional regulator [Gallionellaceae bacterium]